MDLTLSTTLSVNSGILSTGDVVSRYSSNYEFEHAAHIATLSIAHFWA